MSTKTLPIFAAVVALVSNIQISTTNIINTDVVSKNNNSIVEVREVDIDEYNASKVVIYDTTAEHYIRIEAKEHEILGSSAPSSTKKIYDTTAEHYMRIARGNYTTNEDEVTLDTSSMIAGQVEEVSVAPMPTYNGVHFETVSQVSVSPDNTYATVALSEAEVYLLAQLIYCEAGCCSYECQSACGSVAINLMMATGMDLWSVSHNPNMFAVAYIIDSTVPSDMALQVARDIATYGTTVPPSVKCFRTDYYFDFATPYMCIDNVYFGSF